MFIAGNFTHVNGTDAAHAGKHLAAVRRDSGELDPDFRPGDPRGTVRSLAVYGKRLRRG